jgi:hypothetical protein
MKRIKLISLLLIVLLIIFVGTISEQRKTETQDVSHYITEIEEVEQEQPVVHAIQEEIIKESSQLAEDVIAPESSSPIQIEAKTEMDREEVEEEEGIKIVMISVYEPDTDVIPLPTPKSFYDLSEIKGFHILGNLNETPLNLIVTSTYADGCEKIHYLDWNAKHPNEFQLYSPLGYEAFIRIYDNEVQVGQFAVSSSSDQEYIALDLSLDTTTEFACIY